ncbi:MAG: PhnA protein [Rhodobacterales bacterium]|nr:PhnA protein [Rhodobacterales bacterium]NCT13321.1 PhnA protein [Rhodobacterales bacterium]
MTACDLCSATDDLAPVAVAPRDATVTLCPACRAGVTGPVTDAPHWRCLTEAIWSQEPAVQVVAWRLLDALAEAGWARDARDGAYLEPDVMDWAQAQGGDIGAVTHRDSNGVVLAAGDTVTLVKDLVVKGGGFTAKRGTAVRGISLVADNAAHIEGRVNGQQIVILCEFVKKSG